MRRPGDLVSLALAGALGIGLVGATDGETQVRSLSGILRSSASFDDQRAGGTTTQRSELRHDYSLGVSGLILDPRLATFDVTGTFAGNTPLLGVGAQSQTVSGAVNLNILPTSRIPGSLRHSQTHGWNGTTSDVMSSGLTWQVNHPLYPSLMLTVDRTAVKTSGLSPSATNFLAGTLRSNYHVGSLDMFGEVGARRTEDALRDTSTMFHFANLSGTYRPSTATFVQGEGNYFQEGENLSAALRASLTNRPDPTLTRTANLSIRNTRSGESNTYSLDAGGTLAKNYTLSPTLQAFLSGGANFAGDVVSQPPPLAAGGVSQGVGEGFMSLSANGGGGVTYSGLRYLTVTTDASLTGLYEDDQQQGIGARGTFHVGVTGKNLGPVTAAADYTVRAETGVVDSVDHTVSLRGNVVYPVGPTLRLEAFTQSGMFLRRAEPAATSSGATVSFTGGGRAVYTGIRSLTWNLMTQYQLARSGQFEDQRVTTSTILTYTPFGRLRATLTATRDDELTRQETRHSVQADVSYRIGATLLTLTYSLDLLSTRTGGPMIQRALLTWTRPFGWRFR